MRGLGPYREGLESVTRTIPPVIVASVLRRGSINVETPLGVMGVWKR
jgi:hypothetical protein